MQENYKILVVDDDMRLRALLERYLTEQGFQVRSVANAEQMDRLLTRESFHLMVLDLMLPGEDGLSICRRLRSQSNPMPIIMVTAKGEEVDRIVGLEIGADDYVAKPFSPREVCARVRTLLRRVKKFSSPSPVIRIGHFELNEPAAQISWFDTPLTLTRYEFLLLKTLLKSPGRVWSRQQLMDSVWEDAQDTYDRTVDTHIKTLRAKLRAINPDLSPINTHRGMGYSLRGL